MPSSTCPSYNYPYLSRPVSATISVTPVSTNVHLINYATLTLAASIHPARILGCRLPDSWAVTSIGIKVLSLHGSRILYLSSRLWIFKIFQIGLTALSFQTTNHFQTRFGTTTLLQFPTFSTLTWRHRNTDIFQNLTRGHISNSDFSYIFQNLTRGHISNFNLSYIFQNLTRGHIQTSDYFSTSMVPHLSLTFVSP
jgi:hypothetical protein